MRNSVCKTLPLAIAFLLLAVGVAFAGDNAAVTFSTTSPAEFDGIGPGDKTVTFAVAAAGVVGVKQYDVTVRVTPADAFDLNATTFAPGDAAFLVPGKEVNVAAGTVKIGAANLLASVSGDLVLGTFTFTTAAGFTAGTEATITATLISLGPSSSNRDVFNEAALGLSAAVNPPAPAPTITSIAPSSGSLAGGTQVTITGTNFQDGATVKIGGNAATAVVFVGATSLTATVPAGAVGVADVVVTNPDAQSATLVGGFTYLAVIEPTLRAVGATDASLDYSAIGNGDVADGSAGEVSFRVRFTGNTGAAAAGQAISWTITNNGSETVYVFDGGSTEIQSGDVQTVQVPTDADGASAITLDAQGNKQAGTTSVTVAASTTAPNSEGTSRSLSRNFSATWDVPVAAELASFTGAVTPSDQVLLQWSVASQSNNLGWEVYRSTDSITFERIGELVSGDGTTDAFKNYSFTDSDPLQAEVRYYYLKQIDLDGTSARSAVIEVTLATAITQQALPVANALWQNFPNPFNPETTINFELSEEAVVTLTIYDLTGQVVRTLVSGQFMTAGTYQNVWDGRNEVGVRVGSGVYLYRLNAGTFTAMQKMTLLQ
jgi:hypothetical protein